MRTKVTDSPFSPPRTYRHLITIGRGGLCWRRIGCEVPFQGEIKGVLEFIIFVEGEFLMTWRFRV